MKWRCCRDRLSLQLPQINYSVTIGVCLIWELIPFARQMALLVAIIPPLTFRLACGISSSRYECATVSPSVRMSLAGPHLWGPVLGTCGYVLCYAFFWAGSQLKFAKLRLQLRVCLNGSRLSLSCSFRVCRCLPALLTQGRGALRRLQANGETCPCRLFLRQSSQPKYIQINSTCSQSH
jgi:hypothetical protein